MILIPPNALRVEGDCPTKRLRVVVFTENTKIKSFIVGRTDTFSLLVSSPETGFASSASEVTVSLDESSHNTMSTAVPTTTNPTVPVRHTQQ